VESVLVPEAVEFVVGDKEERTGDKDRVRRKRTKERMIGGERMLQLEAMPGEFGEVVSISIYLYLSPCFCFCFFYTHIWVCAQLSPSLVSRFNLYYKLDIFTVEGSNLKLYGF
jgi:hypothetical protein